MNDYIVYITDTKQITISAEHFRFFDNLLIFEVTDKKDNSRYVTISAFVVSNILGFEEVQRSKI